MVDITETLAAKSDQLNADDLIGRTMTIRVIRVTGSGDKDQPLNVYYDGDNGKPYKPGKSMRRVLGQIWGKESDQWIGKSMTIYRDPEIMFGKLKVGGIRISHMEGLSEERTLALTATKGAKRAFIVKPLRVEQQRQVEPMPDAIAAAIKAATGQPALVTIRGENEKEAWWPHVDRATRARLAELSQEQQSDDDGHDDNGQGNAGSGPASDGPDYDGV